MLSVISCGGRQYFVKEGSVICVNRLDADVGSAYDFDVLFLKKSDGTVDFAPEGTVVSGEVLEHKKSKKVLVFKKKRRKGYKRLKGHRQHVTYLRVNSLA